MIEPATLITGASGALGGAIAQHLLHAGHRVIAAFRGSPQIVPKWTQSERCSAVPLDLLDESAWRECLDGLSQPLTGAVLCAGGWAGGAPHHLAPAEVWDRMFRDNLTTTQVSLRMLIPQLHARGGSIVAIGSRSAVRPWEGAGSSAYTASKAALVALVAATAYENLAAGVRINALLPSTIDTPENRAAMPSATYEQWVSTGELAAATEFLLGPGAAGITGAAIPVYGRL